MTLDEILNRKLSVDINDLLYGDALAEPKQIKFRNTDKAIDLLNKHIYNSNAPILIHCDVDMDGIGSGYMLWSFLTSLGVRNRLKFIINSDRVHGVAFGGERLLQAIKDNSIGLLVVLDSSSNETDYIEQTACDVLVIDHHELNTADKLTGSTSTGEYVIVSNMIDEPPYKVDNQMSCGRVLYELLRVYQTENILEEKLLYQWTAVTLLTDAVKLGTQANQYYMDKFINSKDIERCLFELLTGVSKFNTQLTKSVINFGIAPRINKAVRAGASNQALYTVLVKPQNILDLDIFKVQQDDAINKALSEHEIKTENGTSILVLPYGKISNNYNGVIAINIVNNLNTNALVCSYNPELQLYNGSFRGRKLRVKYKDFFTERGIYAQGHQQAFGFRATQDELNLILQSLDQSEKESESDVYFTIGTMPNNLKGTIHLINSDELTQFKKQQGLVKLGVANSRLSTEETIQMICKTPHNIADMTEWNEKHTVGKVSLFGLECKVFEEIETDYISIDVLYDNEVKAYARNNRTFGK